MTKVRNRYCRVEINLHQLPYVEMLSLPRAKSSDLRQLGSPDSPQYGAIPIPHRSPGAFRLRPKQPPAWTERAKATQATGPYPMVDLTKKAHHRHWWAFKTTLGMRYPPMSISILPASAPRSNWSAPVCNLEVFHNRCLES